MHGPALGHLLTRADLSGPGVAVLNLGGFANPDVLVVLHGGERRVVKDWGRRSLPVRALLAPLLARHERAMLARAAGIEGVPRLLAPIDRLALAMELVEGRALRRRTHGRALPPEFFARLERVLDELAARGIVHLDLRSPTNVLVTPAGAPVLVDLGGALRLPLPRAWLRALERRALAKLRARFERRDGAPPLAPPPGEDATLALKAGGTRFCVRDRGPLGDPVPILLVPDAGYSARLFAPLLAAAPTRGRRVLAVDPPGFGGSRRAVRSLEPVRVAAQLEALVDALRVARVDLVGAGWGALVAAAFAARAPARARAQLAIAADAPFAEPPAELPVELRAELSAERAAAQRNLELARADCARAPAPPAFSNALAWSDALPPERLLDELSRLAALAPRDWRPAPRPA